MDFLDGFWYLTVWGTHATFITLFFISLTSYLDYVRKSLRIKQKSRTLIILNNLSLVLFELSISAEVVITAVFWIFLYNDPGNAKYRANSFMEHLNPLLVLLIEYVINPWQFRHQHTVFLVLMCFIYIPWNYLGTEIKGEPIYDIISWEDWETAWYLIGIVILLLGAFHAFAFISGLRNKKEELGSVIVDKNAEGSTSLLIASMEMST